MKVALVHDWLTGMRGGERCLEAFLAIYPSADIFTLVHVPGSTSSLIDSRVKEASFLSRIPGIKRLYRLFLPLYPLAIRSFDFTGYDLVISLSHAAAKNIVVPSGVKHVCYCFTPMRYVWDQVKHYFGPAARVVLFPVLEFLRKWDRAGAARVTHFVAISSFVGARIRLFYGRRSHVIAPPVRSDREAPAIVDRNDQHIIATLPTKFFLCAGALVPYKRIEVVVEAFNASGHPLVVAGKGPELKRLRELARANIFFLESVSDGVLWELYRRCKALIFPGIEDFGIVPVECLAAGRPVIGLNAGGLRDSMAPDRDWSISPLVAVCSTGILISKGLYGSAFGISEAVEAFFERESTFSSSDARARADKFSYDQFYQSWSNFCFSVGLPGPGGSRLSSSMAMSSDSAGAKSLGETSGPVPEPSPAQVVKMVGGSSC